MGVRLLFVFGVLTIFAAFVVDSLIQFGTFEHVYNHQPGNCKKYDISVIYDVTICYHDEAATIMGVVNAEPCEADILFRRFPVKDIAAETNEELSDWLMKLYQDKDELVDYHKKHKRFPIAEAKLAKRPWPELVVYTWLSLLGIPTLLTIFYLVWTGSWFILGIIIMGVVLAEQLFYFIARETETKKTASSYGLKNGLPPKKEQ